MLPTVYPPATAQTNDGRPTNGHDHNASNGGTPAPPPPYPPPPGTAMHPMRLHDPSPVNPPAPARSSRKRKSPPKAEAAAPVPPAPQPGVPDGAMPVGLPPPHALLHPHMPPLGFPYGAPGDFSPGGLPPGAAPPPMQLPPGPGPDGDGSLSGTEGGSKAMRALSQSKRAEQNRKAQRAFRERRDQHVKNLESRSQLLETALQSADEANRRWEECRALVDSLRIENAQLRAENAGFRAENQSLHNALIQSGFGHLGEEVVKTAGADLVNQGTLQSLHDDRAKERNGKE